MKLLFILSSAALFTFTNAIAEIKPAKDTKEEKAVSAKPTQEDAKKVCEDGLKFYQKAGREKAVEALNKADNEFFKGELYIFGIKFDGVEIINPANPSLIGKHLIDLTDTQGKPFVKKMVEVAKSNEGKGFVNYFWKNPKTGAVQEKSTYVLKVDTDLFFGCGIYK